MVVAVFTAHRPQLRRVFMHFCQSAHGGGGLKKWEEVVVSGATWSPDVFQQFCEDFALVPQLLSKHVIGKAIHRTLQLSPTLTAGGNVGGRLQYPQFCEVVGRIALHVFSQHPYNVQYPSAADKVLVLLNRMGITADDEDGADIKRKLKKHYSVRKTALGAGNLRHFQE